MPIHLLDILKLSGFDPSLPTKIVRHQDRRVGEYSIDLLRDKGWLENYQSYQGKLIFKNAKQIVSFYGLSGTRAAFYGVYKIVSHRSSAKGEMLKNSAASRKWSRDSHYFYELKRNARFNDLRDRLIIEWGKGARSWCQNLSREKDKVVLEIQEPGRELPPFTDYLEFSLSYKRLQTLIQHPEAHRDWHHSLCAVAGVYLIKAKSGEHLYVGSAYGVGGIWGRWEKYAKSIHCGNKKLKELVEEDPSIAEELDFSVLQVLPTSMTKKAVIECETNYKRKLGTRAIGLNSN